jgi:hypothetical protein
MGWASGSYLAEDIWNLVREYIPDKDRVQVARRFVELFQSFDCDTLQECDQLMKDVNILYYGEDISPEDMKKLEYGAVFTLLDQNLKPCSYVCVDTSGRILEKKIDAVPEAN